MNSYDCPARAPRGSSNLALSTMGELLPVRAEAPECYIPYTKEGKYIYIRVYVLDQGVPRRTTSIAIESRSVEGGPECFVSSLDHYT